MHNVQTNDGLAEPNAQIIKFNSNDRRHFIGGSDARVIMGDDQDDLIRLWREKRGELEPQDFSQNLIVQLGTATEELNRTWYQRCTGQTIKDVQKRIRHPINRWMAATLDGVVEQTGAIFEAKFMLPWAFSEDGAAEKHMAQLQHNMWVVNARSAALSVITGGGKWVEITVPADALYQHLLLTAEKKFWRCVESGEPPRLFGIETPSPPRIEAVRVVDMSSSNAWAQFASLYRLTRSAALDHDRAKVELKALVPEDALFERGFQADTYPSGHATIGTSLALGLLLVSSSRWRPWLAVAGGCLSVTFTTGVLFAGWHRPSDALGALAWSGLCMNAAAAFAIRMRGRPRAAIAHPSRAAFGSVALAILVAAATWLIASAAAPEYPYTDVPFFVLTGLIIAGAFSLTAWYGWQLRAVDWPAEEPQ